MNSSEVLEIFKEITRIPRESGHEELMTAFLQDFAKRRNLECRVDPIGNVCIVKEASPGKEDVPTLVLQGHQDMVCEKRNGVTHDFQTDPINYVIEDGWMIAKDTTLGADDGIGVAAMLAILESDLPTGKIECVFTISEETGMDGAFGMEKGFFTGRTLINLDSEDEGQMFIGCAGGLETYATFDYTREVLKAGNTILRLAITDGVGGHSGDDINKGRANTIQLMARFLCGELNRGLQLILIRGGNKHNAIARECEAIVAVPDSEATTLRFNSFSDDVKAEYCRTEPVIKMTAAQYGCTEQPVDSEVAARLVRALFACPHGVEAMSQDIDGLVETSTNLAAVRMRDLGKIEVLTSQRSAIASARKMIAAKVEACFVLAGATVEHTSEYPGWKPNVDSRILAQCVESYKKLFGFAPEIKAIHAGLECGLFGEKFGDLDMISFGPTLRGVHAPGEKLDLASLDKFVDHLVDVVTNFN
ncbi:MAG: aminoacyl-histidine dipeptidase [Bacteroidales bacterium]|nr:aminoacyl-histidine dipeptidase [Bacteroidales bacterium]